MICGLTCSHTQAADGDADEIHDARSSEEESEPEAEEWGFWLKGCSGKKAHGLYV